MGQASDKLGDSQHALAQAWDAMRALPGHVHALQGPLCELVELARAAFAYLKRKDSSEFALYVSSAQQVLRTRGYRHNRCMPTANGTLLAEIDGEKFSITVTGNQWNPLDLPEGTQLSSSKTNGQYDTYVWQLTDEPVI